MIGRSAVIAGLVSAVAVGCGGSTASPSAPISASPPPTSAVASSYVASVVQIMRDHSVNRLVIDWNAFTARVNQVAAGAQTIVDTYPAITVALGLLNDHHSFFLPPTGVTARPINLTSLNCQTAAVPNASVPPDIGYVRVGAFSDATPGADVAFADSVQTQIRTQDHPALAGWIVDLRGNSGGNMWPMVAGVGPVLGEGLLGYFVYPTGITETWTYQAGVSSGSGVVSHVTAAYTLLRPAPRVAVLTNLAVASSGEAVAVAFRGRPNTRTFGTATCGLSSSNSPFALSDGAVLYLNTAVDADRNHVVYGGALIPDETIAGDGDVVQRAISWLRSS